MITNCYQPAKIPLQCVLREMQKYGFASRYTNVAEMRGRVNQCTLFEPNGEPQGLQQPSPVSSGADEFELYVSYQSSRYLINLCNMF